MINYQKILVVVNPDEDHQVALERASRVAALNEGAELTLFLPIYDFSYEITTALSNEERQEMRDGIVAQRQEWLEGLLRPYQQRGFKATAKTVWHKRPFEAVIHEVEGHGYDLVVKATHHHSFLQRFIFTPNDWHLLRKCPIPVLLVKDELTLRGGNLLAAVNCSSEDPEQQALCELIAKEGAALAELLGGNLYLVNTYPPMPYHIAVDIPDFDPNSYDDSVRKYHEKKLQELAARHGISSGWLRLEEGLPEDIIPEMARDLKIDLVIMGSVGRTGISAALLGNTAELVIDELDCDMLILKK